jgi:hypothetical protein
MHSVVLVLPSGTLATQPSDLAPDQDHEEESGDTHEHPDAPQEVPCRSAHSHAGASRPSRGDHSSAASSCWL